MKFLAALAIVLFTGAHANAHPIVAVVGGGGSSHTASALIGGGSTTVPIIPIAFIGGTAIAIFDHERRGPACASNTKYNRAHGYNYARLWRPECNWPRTSSRRHTTVKFIKPFSK
jgi:hypothetical protein